MPQPSPGGLGDAVVGAQGFFCTLYMQQILGYSPLVTGLAFLPMTVTVVVAAGVG